MRPGVGRIWNLASSAACLISADCHRPNFQFPSENRGLGGGAILGTDSSVSSKWRNLNRFRLKFGLCPWFRGISTWKTGKFNMGRIWALFGFWPFSGHKNYIVSKLWNLQFVWFEIWQVFLWLWYLKGDRVLNSKFLPKMGVWEWGNFGSQKVRSAINGTIFNRSASNLVCTHYYLVSTPAKPKNSLWNRFGPLFGYWPF